MKKITYLLAGAGIAMCILLGSVRPTFAQETVTGTVRSAEDGVPLPGATVKIAGTGAGTNTDENGRFELTDNRPVITISITSLGYLPLDTTLRLPLREPLLLSLRPNASMLRSEERRLGKK